MVRRLQALFGMLALGLILAVHAQEVGKSKSDPTSSAAVKDDLTLKKEIDARKFLEFQQSLLRLAQRLENSNKPEDRERAVNIRKAIETASSAGIDTQFDRLINILKSSKDLNLQEVQEALHQSELLVSEIRAILTLLLSDNRDDQLKAERLRLTEILKQLDHLIRKEKLNRAHVEAGRGEKRDLVEAERKNREHAEQIARALDKNKDAAGKEGKGKQGKEAKGEGKQGKEGKEGKEGKGEGKEGKEAKGEGKEGKEAKGGKGEGKEAKGGKGEGKEGEGKEAKGGKGEGKEAKGGKGEGKEGEGKEAKGGKGEGKEGKGQEGSGEPKQGQDQQDSKSGNQPEAEQTPGKKQIQDAQEYQKKAENAIDKGANEKASQEQTKAIDELEKARKKLEEILRQLREEEIERLLAALQARCELMLRMQIEVHQGTKLVDEAFKQNPKKDDDVNRGNVQKAIELSKREFKIVEEANKAIQLLAAEGTAVAFPEVFVQVRDDMRQVERRLGNADVAEVTQVIETDIINTLKDMIEALKKAQQEQQARRSSPSKPSDGKPQDQKLVDLLAELKIIRAMQVRVNGRTKAYGERYTGEQASDAEIQKELHNLAQRQQKIFEVTKNIARGKNK